MATTPRLSTTTSLGDLPPEVIERVTTALDDVHDLARANAASRLFRGVPGGRSAVEHALRARAARRGHARALPTELPHDERTWSEELFARERVLELARAHAHAAAISNDSLFANLSVFACADGALRTCGEVEVPVLYECSRGAAHAALGHSKPGALGELVTFSTRVASLAAVRVVAVTVGSTHLLALSDAGAVHGCGENHRGQLGLGDERKCHSFAQVRALSTAPVICIDAQGDRSFALTAAGRAYSWGENGYGQLGHGDTAQRLQPTRIEALAGVRVGGLSAGGTSTLFLSAAGRAYSCGRGSCGQLGHGDEQDRLTPRRIEGLAAVRAVHVSAGVVHSLVVGAAGGVQSFGYGGAGALGHGDLHPLHTPKRIEALAGAHAVKASAGEHKSAVVCADGSVRAFGQNVCGQLGLGGGNPAMQMQPMQALVNAPVVECCMGTLASLFVTADGGVHVCALESAAHGRGVRLSHRQDGAQAQCICLPLPIVQLPSVRTAWPPPAASLAAA